MVTKKKDLSIICKTTSFCNASCFYCFDQINQNTPKHLKIIDKDKLLHSFEKMCDWSNDISWCWHGGEPLLPGKEWYEDILYEMRKIAIKKDVNVNFNMQSNGLLLENNKPLIELLQAYNVNVGISYDGLTNKRSRRYDLPEEVLDLVSGGLLIINKYNIEYLRENYQYFNSHYKTFSFNWSFPSPEHQDLEFFLGDLDYALEKYKDYMLYYIYDKNANLTNGDRTLNDLILTGLGKETSTCNFGKCFESNLYCLSTECDLYKCDEINNEEFFLGTVDDFDSIDELSSSEKIKKLVNASSCQKKTCIENNCEYAPNCYVSCSARSYMESKGQRPYSFGCKIAKTLYPVVYEHLSNLNPSELLGINPIVRNLLISHGYLPAYLKKEIFHEMER